MPSVILLVDGHMGFGGDSHMQAASAQQSRKHHQPPLTISFHKCFIVRHMSTRNKSIIHDLVAFTLDS